MNWLPIDAIPDDLKDGRPVLLWSSFGPSLAAWERDAWRVTIKDETGYDQVLGDVTHYAVIEAPQVLHKERRCTHGG